MNWLRSRDCGKFLPEGPPGLGKYRESRFPSCGGADEVRAPLLFGSDDLRDNSIHERCGLGRP
jgi:hypothetical protein